MGVLNTNYWLHINQSMKRWNLLKYTLNPIDFLSILFAFQCSYFICYAEKGGLFFTDSNLLRLFIWILPFWIIVLSLVKITGIPTKRYKVLFFLYVQSSISVFFLLTLLYFFLKSYSCSPTVPGSTAFYWFPLFVFWKDINL